MERELIETFEVAKKAADSAADGGGQPEEDRCVDALKSLRKMPVTMDVLVQTQVGKRLRALTKHQHKRIQTVASDLLKHWKAVVIEETTKAADCQKNGDVKEENISKSPSMNIVNTSKSSKGIEIKKSNSNPPKLTLMPKCGDSIRDKLREILADAFSKVYTETKESKREEVKNILDEVDSCDPNRVAVKVESAMHEKLGSSTGSQKAKYRSIMFNLKDSKNPDFRRRVLLGEVEPGNIVDLTPEEMASDERKRANKEIKDKALNECERGAAPLASTDQFKCGRCGQRKCTYYQMQTRSADEPMTTFVTCVNCDNRWKFC